MWAPNAGRVVLHLLNAGEFVMEPGAEGDFHITTAARAGDRYFYRVDDHQPVPDPVSRLLPQGVHGPTEIVDPESFPWSDEGWRGLDRRDYVIYELHVGAFSPQGTFDGVIEKLDHLKELGVTVLEVMPVAAFPGERNWGYDGVSPFAVQASYGGPEGLKRLVDAAHRAGLAVMLDVVYNHLGNEGNYLRLFGPYFTARHKTPWGEAVNYDGPGSEGVRRFVVENALYWVREYHLDGLRLDAVQTIYDDSPRHILAEIGDEVHRLAGQLGRRVCVIAESDQNDPVMVRPPQAGGYGLDAVWSDDFHHAVHTVLTGENRGYYQDYGRVEQIVRALNQGFVFQGEHFHYWGAPRGAPAPDVALPAHVLCIQNHDQVGNRARGERLTALVPRGARKLAAALLLLAPHTPLLFMGQEYDEAAPFQFFTSYGDPALQQAVRHGRREEFKEFDWQDVPDPEDPATFERSRLQWPVVSGHRPEQAEMLAWYRELLRLRRERVTGGERTCTAELRGGTIVMQVAAREPQLMVMAGLPGAALPPSPAGFAEALRADEDGFRTLVCRRA